VITGALFMGEFKDVITADVHIPVTAAVLHKVEPDRIVSCAQETMYININTQVMVVVFFIASDFIIITKQRLLMSTYKLFILLLLFSVLLIRGRVILKRKG